MCIVAFALVLNRILAQSSSKPSVLSFHEMKEERVTQCTQHKAQRDTYRGCLSSEVDHSQQQLIHSS